MILAAGCGSPGAPAPPSLNLPLRVQDLSAARVGDEVNLAWTMPARTTDAIPLKHLIPGGICRKVGNGACTPIATVSFAPGKAAAYSDHLPIALAAGPVRLLSYQVSLRNHAGKTAGPSNTAFSATGVAPPALSGLTGEVRPDGVLLGWHAATKEANAGRSQIPAAIDFRIERTLETPVPPARETVLAVPQPEEQTLMVHAGIGPDPGHALDSSAQFGEQYRYTVVRVATVTLDGRSIAIEGQPSEPMSIKTTDIFPPAVPQGLAAVADAELGAIDLSWTPDAGKELAGYAVYRRDLAKPMPPRRIAPQSPSQPPITAPAFHDAAVERGHTYAYSISAVSVNGYESLRSPEVVETVPNS